MGGSDDVQTVCVHSSRMLEHCWQFYMLATSAVIC